MRVCTLMTGELSSLPQSHPSLLPLCLPLPPKVHSKARAVHCRPNTHILRAMFCRLDFEEEDDGPSGGVQTLMPAETLKHPSFNLLDRVERYVGSTRRDDPWDPNSIFSKGITADETSGLSTENAAHHKMLTTLVSDIVNLSSELFNIKRELKIGDDGTQASSKYAESEASSAASKPLSDIDAVAAYRPKKPDAAIAKQSNLSNPPTDSVTSIPAESPRSTRVGPGREITAEEMAMHSDPKSLWLAVDGVVRDCTALLDFHPGGRSVLLSAAGDDCSDTFHASHIGSSYASASAGLKKFKAVGLFSRKI